MIELLLQAERALEMGRIDAAETLYRQVSTADPRNSIAVVGLARVTLERGDELAAYLLARRAMSIDPENAAASRMVQRLEEVMRFRGDEVPDVPESPKPVEAGVDRAETAVAGAEAAGSAAGAVAAGTGTAEEAEARAAPKGGRSMVARILDRLLGR